MDTLVPSFTTRYSPKILGTKSKIASLSKCERCQAFGLKIIREEKY